MTDFDELERLARAATPGPWEMSPGPVAPSCVYASDEPTLGDVVCAAPVPECKVSLTAWPANAAFIAAANPTAVLELLDRVAELERRNTSLMSAMAKYNRLLDAFRLNEDEGDAELITRITTLEAALAAAQKERRTEFSIEKCGKCGLEWDGEWPADKCYWAGLPQENTPCPIRTSATGRQGND